MFYGYFLLKLKKKLQNRDFAKFLKDIKIDFDSKRIHKNEYDDILPDLEENLANLLGTSVRQINVKRPLNAIACYH